MQALDRCAARNPFPGRAYARRQPEKTPPYQVFQRHLPAFERMWADTESGGCLPKFVTGELQGFQRCGILAYGFAQMHCESCHKRHLVAFSCKGRGFRPSCIGRRMNESAANLGDPALPEGVHPWLSRQQDRINHRHSARFLGPAPPRHPHFHTLFLDGAYRSGSEGETPVFEPTPRPTQQDIEAVVTRAHKRICNGG